MPTRLVPEVGDGGGGTLPAVMLLVGVLIAKEILVSAVDPPNRPAGRILDVVLVPLAVVFVLGIVSGLWPLP